MRLLFAAAVAACLIVLAPVFLPALYLASRVVPGMSFWHRTSDRYTLNIASFHSSHSLTWSWVLSFIRPRSAGEGRWLGLHAYSVNTGWTVYLQLARCQIMLTRQYPMHYRTHYQRSRDRQHGLVMLLIAALPLGVAGCTTTNPATGETDVVAGVQSAATAACRFLPTAETVTAILAGDDPRLATASAIARAICDAVAPAAPGSRMMTLMRAVPEVSGVPIRGEFVGG